MTPADSRRIRLVSNAVMSSYIHEISTRGSSGDRAPEPARPHDARADRLAHTRRALRRRRAAPERRPPTILQKDLGQRTRLSPFHS
jgi:hypothetical protein